MYKKLGYQVNFIPVLFLKAFDNTIENNEYVYIKFKNLDIENIKQRNIINNDAISRILLPEIIKLLDIKNKDALDYNGYLLDRKEKDMILNARNNDILIDIFTTSDKFNGEIVNDSKIFYNTLKKM